MSDESGTSFTLDEPGFRGDVTVSGPPHELVVHVIGVRPEGREWTAVEKVIDAHRDPELNALAEGCATGDTDAAVRLLAHVGVMDPV